jgi:methyl-accepting chemotaxis protein
MTSRSIIVPLAKLRLALMQMAEGRTDIDTSIEARHDELGEVARAVGHVRESAVRQAENQARSQAQQAQAEHEAMERHAAEREQQATALGSAIRELGQGLSAMASGDFTVRLDRPFVGELDALRADFNSSVETLRSTVQQISQIAFTLDSGSKQISSAANSLASRTEQQAASVEQTAAAIEEISTTVADSTKRAEQAGTLVNETRTKAEKSGDIVAQAVSAMGQIESSSAEVTNIIGVIDEIAFQTNLLALNAGVEAARAGEAGKGFAVVAQEVRELAQRSATAAREIKQLIGNSTAQVRNGVELVSQTGSALSVIVRDVQEISQHVGSIVESAREQSTGLKEINTAVNLFDQSVQQNAAMVEEMTAESHNLAKEAAALASLVAQFRTGSSAPKPVQSPAQHSPVTSPARGLMRQVRSAWNGSAALKDEWQEF